MIEAQKESKVQAVLTLLKQRLTSKTYWAGIILALLTVVEVKSGIAASYLPPEYQPYLIAVWPIIMLLMREVTVTALSDK
jgi:hypothetical protein